MPQDPNMKEEAERGGKTEMAPTSQLFPKTPNLGRDTTTALSFIAVFLFFSFLFFFLGLQVQHMEFPGLGVELEPRLWPTPQLTATPDA